MSTSLVKISQLDATALLYPAGIGFRNVEGLVAAEDPDTSAWNLIGAFNVSDNRLEIVNPDNGNRVTWACSLASIDCQGLAFTTRLRDPYWSIVQGSTD